MQHGIIEIKAAEPTHTDAGAARCGGCLHSAAGPVCRVVEGHTCMAPQLSGPPEALGRVMDALALALASPGQPVGDLVHALRLAPGDEVELTLNVAPHCSGVDLADRAFQTLRSLLPNTDIYVHHLAP
ncbi:hypothetical protein BurJ1DRAFT_0542 [Burkholderiales bacterium JOSHI_001]|nr:hypothetical protein BurJ1DRAFT_0542 [Burkholderiales bacterium JOSHI_001]